MFNGQQKYNNASQVSVNTNLFNSYSDTCRFQVIAWNDKISLKFSPMIGVSADGIRQYSNDKSDSIFTSLNGAACVALIDGIEKNILPAIKEKKDASVCIVVVSNGTRIAINVAHHNEAVTISAISGVDENGKASDSSVTITHIFGVRQYYNNYNPTSDTVEKVTIQADFINFLNRLKDIDTIQLGSYHSNKYGTQLYASFNTNRNAGYNSGTTPYQAPSDHMTGSISDFLADVTN